MLGPYRRALALPGAWQFSLTGLVARLPIAMVGLGIVLFISTKTGSYALAGATSAAFQVAAAAGALVTSRWMDRVGQRRLLPALASLNAVLLVLFVVVVELGAPVVVTLACAAAAGAVQPAIGSMVRARWAHAAPDAERLRSAFAIESIVDELIFTLGPLLTAILAFQVALPAPLIAGAVIGLVGGLVLAAQRTTQPPASGPRDRSVPRERTVLAQPGLAYVVVAALGIGGVFGTYEVSVVAFTEEAGRATASGLILALWALGSMIGGIVFGARQWSRPLPQQVLILTAVMTAVLIPTPFIGTIPLLALTTLVGGAAVAPALISVFSLTERLVPSHRLTEGLTWTNSGLAIGFSAGATIGGAVVDAYGTTWSFALPALSAATSVVVTLVGLGTLSRAAAGRHQPAPGYSLTPDAVPGPAPGGVIDDPDAAPRR